MKRAMAVLATAGLLAVWGTTAHAQSPVVDLGLAPIDATPYPTLSAVVTAPRELNGQELGAGAVTVIENGIAQPTTLVRLPGNRLEVVLVVDTSGSMGGAAFASAKSAAGMFIARLPSDARVALVAFSSTPILASPLVQDRNVLLGAIDALQARGETALYDAVKLATTQFSGDPNSRRSIVVLSDGGDTASAISLGAATSAVTAADVRLDVVQLVTAESDLVALEQLASAGAGSVAPAANPAALAGVYDSLASSLADQYAISWRSTSHGTTQVTVRLEQSGVVAESKVTLEYPALPAPPPSSMPSAPTATDSNVIVAVPEAVVEPVAVGRWTLVLGAGCVALALFLLGLYAFAPRTRRLARGRLGTRHPTLADTSALSELVGRATASADAALERHGQRGALNDRLEQAGLALRAGEYVVLTLAGSAIGFAVGLVLSGLLLGVLLGAFAGAAAYLVPTVLRSRRRAEFSNQLPDTLQLMAGSLRAGYGLLQAVDAVGREAAEPTSTEFRRLVVEARLGRDVSDSFHSMTTRIGSNDFDWVVQAIDIHREVGGDLAEVLDTVAATIRERNQTMRQVKTLTAEGRLSAYILTALPIVLAAALRVVNPSYFKLLTFGPGLYISGVAIALLVVGAVWFRKQCQLDY
ncbi:MAG TPA: VWA domain-containing protein [Acidimicrobiales bacterium]|nr:VWA domain-containing protein [Acidimicrobiales bacterium]